MITNSAGTALGINSYDEYGIPSSTNLGRFQYTGQTWMPELGMYYYKARIYSATLGRFLQTDPIGYKDGPNWYNYVGSDPVNGRDPSGRVRFYGTNGNGTDVGGWWTDWAWQDYWTVDPEPEIVVTGGHLTNNQSLAGWNISDNINGGIGTPNDGFASVQQTSGTWSFATAYRLAQEIKDQERRRTTGLAPNAGHNDIYDAERHARTTYRIASEVGPSWAQMFGVGYEYLEEVRPYPQPSSEFFMDIHNNNVGINAFLGGEGIPTINNPNLIYIGSDQYYAK